MTVADIDYPGREKGDPGRGFHGVWEMPQGFDNLTSVSHRVVGKRFVVTGFIFFLIAGALALAVRTQLIVPSNAWLDAETYNQVFTMHGTIMMFLFAVPILEGVAVYLIPMMIGARDLVFPRLGAFGFYCYVFGGLILLASFLFDAAPASGWFMYTPLTTSEYTPGLSADFWLIGITFAEVASVTAAVELIVAILCTRAPGMSLTRMPIFCWYILATAFMIAIGFPPLIIGSILLEVERQIGLPFFDPALGGDPLLWQHLFWLFGHPEVYIIFLPAAGMVSTILPVMVGRPIFGYGYFVAALATMALISFGLWAHHMYATGLPNIALSVFSAASMMVTIPTGVQIFGWIATLSQGRPRLEPPMLFILGFLFVFVLGGLTGVMVAAVPFDLQAHDSYFIVAHLHYVLVGGMVFPLFAGAYYWLPNATGRMLSRRVAFWVFGLMFVGFNGAFFPMHITGLLGMPRRIATYPEGLGWDWLNLVSSLFAYMFAAGVLLFVWDFFAHRRRNVRAGRNPWGASTLEWHSETVPPGYNFRSIPTIRSRDPLWDQPELTAVAAEDAPGSLRVLNDGRRETLGCHPTTGAPFQIVRLPHPTWIPFVAAVFTAFVFLGLLAKLYWLSLLGCAGALVAFTVWGWEPSDEGATRETGPAGVLPVNVAHPMSHTHVGTVGTLIVTGALWFSVIFSGLYLWNVQPDFAERMRGVDAPWAWGALAAAALAAACARLGWLAGVRRWTPALFLLLAAVFAAVSGAALVGAVWRIDPWETALGATVWAGAGFVALHLFVALWWALVLAARLATGSLLAPQRLPRLNCASFTLGVGVMAASAAGLLLLAEV